MCRPFTHFRRLRNIATLSINGAFHCARVLNASRGHTYLRPQHVVATHAEATNAFNVVNFGQPGNSGPSDATSTTLGAIRGANAMRRLQLGVCLTF